MLCLSATLAIVGIGCPSSRPATDASVDAAADAAAELDAPRVDGGRGDVGPLTRPRDAAMPDAPDAGPCGDCSVLEGPCQTAHCDPAMMRCVVELRPADTACDDANECTENDACDAIGACIGTPLDLDTPCDDGSACTVDDACDGNGACAATPLDCTSLDGPCAQGICDPAAGACATRVSVDCATCPSAPGSVCVAGACVPPPSPLRWTFDAGLPASWDSGGDAPWVAVPGAGHAGGTALASAPIGASRTSVSVLRVTTTRPSELSFWYRVSSEPGWDFFRVVVDGALTPTLAPVSGEVGWTSATVRLMASGAHQISFVYDKDGSLGIGEDRAYIDDIVLTSVEGGATVTLGPGPVRERFEGPGLPAGARTSAGPAAWFIDTTHAFEGSASVASGEIPDDTAMGSFSISDLELDVTSAAGEGVEVTVRTSTENNYDFFELLVDGALGARLSGVHEWTTLAAALGPPGDHVVTLRYRKDYSLAGPEDRVWVDALRIAPVAGMTLTPSVCR